MAQRNFFGSDTPQTRAAQANQIWEARNRARDQIVDSFETVDDPRDVAVDHRGRGVGPADEFLEWAEPQEMAHQFDEEIPEYDVEPGDVQETASGWGLTPGAERGVAAARFEADTPLEEVDPQDDIRRTDDGFELRDRVLEENQSLFF